MAAKIKSGDLVKVIRGKDRGKEGTVKQVLKDDRLIVEGVQIVKKHVRATQQGQQAASCCRGSDSSLQRDGHRSGDQAAHPRAHRRKGRGS